MKKLLESSCVATLIKYCCFRVVKFSVSRASACNKAVPLLTQPRGNRIECQSYNLPISNIKTSS